jgi:hypothetical protein
MFIMEIAPHSERAGVHANNIPSFVEEISRDNALAYIMSF